MRRSTATAAAVAHALAKAGVTEALLAEEGQSAASIGLAGDIIRHVVGSTPPNKRHFLSVLITPEGTRVLERGALVALLRDGDLLDLAAQIRALPFRPHHVAVVFVGDGKAPPSVTLLPLAMVAS